MQVQQQARTADTIDLMINMGPQHPSTHGVFRVVIWVDGERIVKAEPHIGYLHRGSEKLCEGELYSQVITLFDRLDYVANLNCELAFCLAVEKLMALEVPDRASYIRVILCELNRIASHMLFYGVYGLDVGAMTPILYGFRERERIQGLFESVTGALFGGRAVSETTCGKHPAVVVEVTGEAHYSGEASFRAEAGDPLGGGFLLR